jgi:predicted N-acetyltransferase YhbS
MITYRKVTAEGCGRLILYGATMANSLYKNFGFEDCAGYMTYVPPAENRR